MLKEEEEGKLSEPTEAVSMEQDVVHSVGEEADAVSPINLLKESIASCTVFFTTSLGDSGVALTEEQVINSLAVLIDANKDCKDHIVEKMTQIAPLEDFEISREQLGRIVRRCRLDPDASYQEWEDWIQWRRKYELHEAKDSDFSEIINLGIASWRGQDREGRPCLVLTGRLLDSQMNKSRSLFRRYAVYLADQGVQLCDEQKVEKCCILYDRREMGFEHIDNGLSDALKPQIREISRFYRDRVGVLYVFHLNILWRMMFFVMGAPLLWLMDSLNKILPVRTEQELMEYFDSSGLLLSATGLPDNL